MIHRRDFLFWFFVIVFAEVLSRLVIFFPFWNAICAILIGAVVFILATRRPSTALGVLAIEYLIGSKGALFKIGGDIQNDGGVSIRIILFVAFFLGWLVWSLHHKTWRLWKGYLKGRSAHVGLAALLLFAFFLGVFYRSPFVLVDANAWVTWFLLLPVLDLVSVERNALKAHLVPAIIAALVWLPLKTIAIFFLFSHGWAEVGGSFYLWLRRTGVGEITSYGQGLHRVFLQSQIFGVLTIILFFTVGWFQKIRRKEKWVLFLLLLSFVEILLSLSRSFWIGCAVGIGVSIVIGGIWIVQKLKDDQNFLWKELIKNVVWFFGIGASAFFVVWLIFMAPGAHGEGRASFFNLFVSRVSTEEKAALSRWQLLPILWEKIEKHPLIGSGFGATVTYQTKDPRIVQKTGGLYTTYAFEWGWLDFWIKFGILGIPVMAWLLVSIGWRAWKNEELSSFLRVGIPASLVGLASVHVFTPYLNHPLGMVFLLGLEIFIEKERVRG